MLTAFYILIGILLFGLLIAIHEFGHFITAKLCGVQVNEYSINMGPKLIQKKKGETLYTLRLIPIGGYCAMEGEDGESDNPRAFTNAKWWKRLIILVAGSFMNFLTGFIIVAILLGIAGGVRTATITGFMEGNLLEEQGLQLDDTIYSIGGKRVYVSYDLSLLLDHAGSKPTDIVVIRDGEKVTLKDFRLQKVHIKDSDGQEGDYFGLTYGGYREIHGLELIPQTWYQCINYVRMTYYGLLDLFTGRLGLKDMGGPVQIVKVITDTGTEARTIGDGLLSALNITAFLAITLAVMNMLPIPALDGGRVLFLLIGTVYTAITKKRINPKYEGYIHAVFMVLLLGLMAFIFVKDIVQIAGG